MAHYYVVRQKLDKTGAEDKVRYYGVPVTWLFRGVGRVG